MNRLIIVLICGFLLAPLAAGGQQWMDPYTDKDGTQVEGHWLTPEDKRKDNFSTPGKVNPYTGQFNPYTGSFKGPQPVTPTPANPIPKNQNPYYSQPDYKFQPKDYNYQGR